METLLASCAPPRILSGRESPSSSRPGGKILLLLLNAPVHDSMGRACFNGFNGARFPPTRLRRLMLSEPAGGPPGFTFVGGDGGCIIIEVFKEDSTLDST